MQHRRLLIIAVLSFGILGFALFFTTLNDGDENLAYGQAEPVELAGPEVGNWIIAYLDPDNSDLIPDACFVLGQLIKGDASSNEPGELGTSEGITVALKILLNFGLIEWNENHWVARAGAADEFRQFCPQSSNSSDSGGSGE